MKRTPTGGVIKIKGKIEMVLMEFFGMHLTYNREYNDNKCGDRMNHQRSPPIFLASER